MKADKRATFKRAELHQLSTLLEAATNGEGPTRMWNDGASDATIAEKISAKLNRPISEVDVRRVRHQVLGKMASEGRPTPELISGLLKTVEFMGREISQLKVRVTELEAEFTEPDDQPRVPAEAIVTPKNGYHGRR